MIKLTESQLFEYLRCGTYYDMKYRLGLSMVEEIRVNTLVEGCVKYWFAQRLDNKCPGTADMKRHWDSVCGRYNLEPKQIFDGMGKIAQFMLWTERNQATVQDVDTPYVIVYGSVELSGHIGILLQSNNQTELFVPDFSSKLPDQRVVDMKLSYTLQSAAYERVYDKPLSGIHIHSFKHDRDIYSRRSKDDTIRLRSTVCGAGQCIQDNLMFPRESFLCENCVGLVYCKGWRI